MERDQSRALSVDLLRGLQVWLMLINGNLIDKQLWWGGFSHGTWAQTTVTDLVYPIFLVVAGLGLHYSYIANAKLPDRIFLKKLILRSVRLICLGALLRSIPTFERIPAFGTLQCIGYSFILSALVLCGLGRKMVLPIAIAIQIGALFVSIFAAPFSDRWIKGQTVFEQIDIRFLGYPGHMEGMCGTIVAASYVLFGFSLKAVLEKKGVFAKAALGMSFVIAALILHYLPSKESPLWVPAIPRLFTFSFSIYVLGMSILLLAIFELLLQTPGRNFLIQVILPFGRNSILAYAGVIAVRKIFFDTCIISCSEQFPKFKLWLVNEMTPSLGYSISVYFLTATFLFSAWLVCWMLYRKGIIIKI